MREEVPRRFEHLCFRALTEARVSVAKAAELLEISAHDLNQRMEEPPDLEQCSPGGRWLRQIR